MLKRDRKASVYYPKNFTETKYTGEVYGYFQKETNYFNILENVNSTTHNLIGIIYHNKNDIKIDDMLNLVYGYYEDNTLIFIQDDKKINSKAYQLTANIFSRNTGILETSQMLDKSVIISGCGSVGSLVALELARSGVGSFLLIDNDIFEYHNICRHQCGVSDVGKYKVDALKQRILDINPNSKVLIQSRILENVPKYIFDEFCDSSTIIIGCADNRIGDLFANNKVSYGFNIPFVSIGFWERAFAGEIFYSLPYETACYNCQFENVKEDEDSRVNAKHRFYIDEQEIEDTSFEPGISIDINFVTTIGIKLIIDILNKKDDTYIPKVIDHLTQYTLICNTNDTKIGGDRAEIFSYPLQVTTSIKVEKKENCKICGDKNV